jgi:hypothetical protein
MAARRFSIPSQERSINSLPADPTPEQNIGNHSAKMLQGHAGCAHDLQFFGFDRRRNTK